MSAKVVRIAMRDPEILLDHEAMNGLRRAVGAEAFDEIFEDAIFEITERLSRLEALLGAGDLEGAARLAHDLVSVAGAIGLAGVSRVAMDLEARCRAQDAVPARAIGERLVRVGHDSLVAAAELSVDIGARLRGA